MPAYWADGSACATGCRPAGALTGWPLRPFHRQHPLRSGLNEWRPANMHIGIDIQALDGTAVYAIQSATASVTGVGTVDIRVIVGNYEYWHVKPAVHPGQHVTAHRTIIGHVIRGAGHLHLSETRGGYLNPLRPGGRVLSPYHDTDAPVIGHPVRSGGQVFVEVFDPQSLRETMKYRTPVLAPAAVAWRARDGHGKAVTPLVFSYRGSHHYPTSSKGLVYGPGTTPPNHVGSIAGGWACFWRFVVCVPKWNYRLAGVPSSATSLSVYAWDWAGNVAMRTSSVSTSRSHTAARSVVSAVAPSIDVSDTD
ncbi:MAG: Peptidase family [Gaiellaceae bacterium]|nr:Peptidase family [Gaiellaceae bacterium]